MRRPTHDLPLTRTQAFLLAGALATPGLAALTLGAGEEVATAIWGQRCCCGARGEPGCCAGG